MRRLGVVLGGALLVVIIAVGTVATQVQFGDGKTLADRVPVAGGLARIVDPGQGPFLILPADEEKLLPGATCGDFWSESASGRLTVVSPLARALSDQSGQQVDAPQAAGFVDGACQPESDDQSIDDALKLLAQRAADGEYPAELCRLWKADLNDLFETGEGLRPSAEALGSALDGEGDLRPLYDALVTAERVTRGAADQAGELELKTHAGRVTAALVSDAQKEASNAHRRFIGRSTDFESWSRGPSNPANFRRWTRVLDGAQTRFERAVQDPGLTPALVGEECRTSAAGPRGS